MILLTAKETGLGALVDDHDIVAVDTLPGRRPYSRIYIKNQKENHDFFLDVLEDSKEIKRRIKYEKLDLGCEARAHD